VEIVDSKKIRYLVGKMVNSKKIIWPKEVKILKNLTKKYPDFSFWESFSEKNKFFSLTALLKQEDNLFSMYCEYSKKDISLGKPAKQQELFQEEKVGEDIIVTRPKTLKDFLQ
jgi:hypothetical protein